MKKIFIIPFIFLILVLPKINVYASDNIKAKIGNNYYDTLEEAINAATKEDTIILTNNVTFEETFKINKTVNINLNNNNISADQKVFLIEGGSLNLTGTGSIKENKPYYGAIMLKGSKNQNDKDYSTVSIGENVTLEGWSGIFIDHNDNNTGYGINVNMNGTIKSVNDIDGGTGAGIYVNGNIQHEDNSPIINLTKTTKITSTGNGIYAAGYATYNINGAYIEGKESGLGIKSGEFNIIDGTILGTGEDKTPTSGNNNGINASGSAIQLESNKGYKGNIKLNIKNGTFKSIKSNVIYEYTVNNTNTKVKEIDISGGNYKSDAKKDVFRLSDSLKNTHPTFITGGSYSSDPTPYLESTYKAEKDNNIYKVIQNTINVFKEDNNSMSITPYIIIIIISISLIASVFYLNSKKFNIKY